MCSSTPAPRRNTYITSRLSFNACWRIHCSLRMRSVFHATSISFQGYIIGQDRMEMDPANVCVITSWPILTPGNSCKSSWGLQTSTEGSSGNTALWLLHSPLSPPPRYPSVDPRQPMRHSSILRSGSLQPPASWLLTPPDSSLWRWMAPMWG